MENKQLGNLDKAMANGNYTLSHDIASNGKTLLQLDRYDAGRNGFSENPFAPDPVQDPLVFTSLQGNNADLIERVAKLYLRDGNRIADVTYGKGVFWKKIDRSRYDFHPSDIVTCPDHLYDFCQLPYHDNSFDVVVLDPPYVHTPGKMIYEARYQNKNTTGGKDHKSIINLYREGMAEAWRILKDGGFLWVKCKDEIESGKQKWSHVEIHDGASELGFYVKDFFILTPPQKPLVQVLKQKHARKNHSYLWIFEKTKRRKP